VVFYTEIWSWHDVSIAMQLHCCVAQHVIVLVSIVMRVLLCAIVVMTVIVSIVLSC
jgi:hypothetical protein